MVGKAVNDLKRKFIRWALIIALAGTAAGASSVVMAEAPLESLKEAVRRYATSPLALDHPPSPAPVKPQVVFHGDRRRKRVALTFDACATKIASGYDEEVIRVLIETRTPATLFLGGKWMLEHPDQTRRLAAVDLFELGNHSFLHPHMTRSPDDQVRQELGWTQIVMYSLTGRQASLYRPPYGEHDERISRITAEAGLITVQFDLASGDPDPGTSKERLLRSVTTGARNGSIVVMHMNGRGWNTAQALPDIIGELRRKGFRLVTVGEMLRAGPGPDSD
ncbi:MAG: polysaccharide deacetylase family protein [Deltaproteobacteria bacterium]|nr:polysaccharide deacetylase family protein [Deltaproteobacteria bacterium]